MDEDERKRQQFEEHMKQMTEEMDREKPDPFWQGVVGYLVGGSLGPLLLVALFFLLAALYPDDTGGSPVMFFLFLLMAVAVGGAVGAALTPFVVGLKSRRRKPK